MAFENAWPPDACVVSWRYEPMQAELSVAVTSGVVYGGLSSDQLEVPPAQVSVKATAEQVPMALGGGAQAAFSQMPAWQKYPEPHACPQVPQLALELVTLASQPLAALPSQSPKPPAHARTQALARQAPVALGALAQTTPQPPQLEALAAVATSQPLATLPSQSAKPVVHPHV
jgi:hypothetical protein